MPVSLMADPSSSAVEREILLREQLAALAHEQWSGWMRYLFSRCEPFRDGYRIPHESALRWERQMSASYAELSEAEKESDRKEADRVLALLTGRIDPEGPAGSFGYCSVCYHPLDLCSHCENREFVEALRAAGKAALAAKSESVRTGETAEKEKR